MKTLKPYVPACAVGERCSMCGEPATRKVCENIFDDDPQPIRHELTAYVCQKHFDQIMIINRAGYTRPVAQADLEGLKRDAWSKARQLSEMDAEQWVDWTIDHLASIGVLKILGEE